MTRRPALSTGKAACGTVLVFIGLFIYLSMNEFAMVIPEPVWVAVFALLAIGPIGATLFWHLQASRYAAKLEHGELVVDERFIRREAAGQNGALVIDRGEPIQWRYLHLEHGFAIYRLYQAQVELDFTSDEPQAEQIVTEVLQLPWPPKRVRGLHYAG